MSEGVGAGGCPGRGTAPAQRGRGPGQSKHLTQHLANDNGGAHLDASVPEVIEVLLGGVSVGLRVRGGGDGDPGQPDEVAANYNKVK